MNRRAFITFLGGAAIAWPPAARAQHPALPVVGFLSPNPSESAVNLVTTFRQGLSETGFVEGRNVVIEYRWAKNDSDRLPELVADLVRRRVAVICISGSTPATLAAKAATATIPIVFLNGGDPVQSGLVASFDRPGGNLTGISTMSVELGSKRLGLLHELLPRAARIAVLVNSGNPLAAATIADLQAASLAVGVQLEILTAGTSGDIDTAFASLAQKRVDALLAVPDPLFFNRRVQLATLAVRQGVPTMFPFRENAEAGGLMSYGSNATDLRQVGIYAGRILKGEKPADLPVMRATRFELVINLQTAKTLGIEVPPTLLALADEVIE